ncbi:MAG: hypothetical protein OIF55_12990 [Amphritea sp.]|nr:hypothetical protein [Amphritea sp.]
MDRVLKLLALFFIFFLNMPVHAQSVDHSPAQELFEEVDLAKFYIENQIADDMAEKKHRLMLQPSPVRFQAFLMSMPKLGSFSLVYDAFALWTDQQFVVQDKGAVINHSAFLGLHEGPVLGVYLSDAVAHQLKNYSVGTELEIYAVHIYNYSGGPRLVVLGVTPVKDSQ